MNRGVVIKAKNPKYVLKHLLRYILKFKFQFVLVILFTILTNLFQLIGPYLSGLAVDEIDISKKEVKTINLELVLYYCLLMFGFYVISCILSLIINYLMINVSKKIVYQMRKDLFNKLLDLPVKFFDSTKTGDIISRISYDIDTINTSLSSDVVATFLSINVFPKASSL